MIGEFRVYDYDEPVMSSWMATDLLVWWLAIICRPTPIVVVTE